VRTIAVGGGLCDWELPLCPMQPAMAGLCARRMPTPLRNCLPSLAAREAFGRGRFLAAWS